MKDETDEKERLLDGRREGRREEGRTTWLLSCFCFFFK